MPRLLFRRCSTSALVLLLSFELILFALFLVKQDLNDFILYIISSPIDARDAQMRDGKVAIELTGFDLDVVKEIAEETECADLSECVYDMIQAAIKERNETPINISLPNHLISLIDESVEKGKYESRSQMINFILRGYFGTIGKILR